MPIPDAGTLNIKLWGDVGTGCSSTVWQVADRVYTGKFIPTIGVDFKDADVDDPVSGKGVPLRLYDSSEDRFRSIINNSSKPVLAHVIAFHDRKSFESVKTRWLEECRTSTNFAEAPIILMRTKDDQEPANPRDRVTDDEIEQLMRTYNENNSPKIVDWCSTSAKKDRSIAPFQRALQLPAAQAVMDNMTREEWVLHKAEKRREENSQLLKIAQQNVQRAQSNVDRHPDSATEAQKLTEARAALQIAQERVTQDDSERLQLESRGQVQQSMRQEMQGIRDENKPPRIRYQDELRDRLDAYITRVEEVNSKKDSFLHKFWIDSKQRHFSRDVNLEFAKLLRERLGKDKGEDCIKEIDIDALRETAWTNVSRASGFDGVQHRSARNSSELDGILTKLDEARINGHLHVKNYNSPQLK